MAYTLTFAERNQNNVGWTSFWTYYPQQMMDLGNRFYTIHQGQLWEHNDNNNPVHRVIYGEEMISKISVIINEANAEDKIFKNLILESNKAWDAFIETNMTESTIKKEEFNNRDSKWFAHTRKNELVDDLTDRIQGIGTITSINGSIIAFESLPTLISIGETLFQLNELNEEEEIGIITDISGNTVTVTTIETTPIIGRFAYSVKNARIQGSEIRGYYAEVTLTNNDPDKVKLFAIGSNIVRSVAPTQI